MNFTITQITFKINDLVEKLSAQQCSYGTLGQLLSALECFAYRSANLTIKEVFKGFNLNDLNNIKTLNELKNQIITQIEIFKFSFQSYEKQHGTYLFPKELPRYDLISLIHLWRLLVPTDAQKYYDAVIEIINRNFEVSYITELKQKKYN